MNQTRLESLLEAWVNVAIGFGINFTANMIVLPWFGFPVSSHQALGIGFAYTVISVARSYVVRRWFNAGLHKMIASAAARLARAR